MEKFITAILATILVLLIFILLIMMPMLFQFALGEHAKYGYALLAIATVFAFIYALLD